MTPSTRRLVVGRTLSAGASGLMPTTLTLALLHSAKSGSLGLVLACELLPMLVLLPVAGVAADRFAPQRVVLISDLVRAVAQLTMGAELLCGIVRVPDLAVLSAMAGGAVAFGYPAVRTLVAGTISGPERLRVNALLGASQGLAQIAAPSVAGTLMLAVGGGWSSLLTGLLFVGSATTLGGLRPARPPRRAERGPFMSELRGGWAETRRHPWFLANVVGHGTWHLATGFLLTLGPMIAVRSLGGASSWVVVSQVGMVGMVIGVFAVPRLPIRRPLVAVAVGAAANSLPLLAFALRLPLAAIICAYFIAMFGLGVLDPLWETTMQHRIPQEALGRVGSLDSLISTAVRPLGLAMAVPIASAVGTTVPLVTAAVLVGCVNLSVLLLPQVRERPAPAPAATGAPVESVTG